ncbi:MAG: heme exporter protein CcmD [Legionella sp.]|nr:heme exporter protein CcmD [Legionella sp.]
MMHAFITWLDMGGYAAYVWPAYGTVLMVLLVHVFQTRGEHKRTLRTLRRWMEASS